MTTTFSAADPQAFLEAATPAARRRDGLQLSALAQRVTGQAPRMFGTAIVGFGEHRYTHDSGRSGITPTIGFSPRKTALVVYLANGLPDPTVLARLGPHSTGVGCLYLKDLQAVDVDVLTQILTTTWQAG